MQREGEMIRKIGRRRIDDSASRFPRSLAFAALLTCVGMVVTTCGGDADEADGHAATGGARLSGTVLIDGSSTVFPIAEAMAEEFAIAHEGQVRVPVGSSGTGGGFQKFCAGETDISNASRPMTGDEAALCRESGIEPIELPIAWDGLTVVRNPANYWATCMTVEELRRIWQPGSTIERWDQVRDEWPEAEIELYGADTDSGTFDYFTEAIMGESGSSRDDYTASADDNVLVVGVAGDAASLGYFGFAYYMENAESLEAIEIDGGAGCVAPTRETIEDGSYTPLSRPMFIYAKAESVERPVVAEFLRFWMENSAALVPEVGYVSLAPEEYGENVSRLEQAMAPGTDAEAGPAAEPAATAGAASGEATGIEHE